MNKFESYLKRQVKKSEIHINNNKCKIGDIVYFMGHNFEIKHIDKKDFYLYNKNLLISGYNKYQELFPNEKGIYFNTIYTKNFELSNKELNLVFTDLDDYEFGAQWFINAVLLTKEQIYNNLDKFGIYEFDSILNIYMELSENDLNDFIEKDKCVLYNLINSREMNLNFWKNYLNKILQHPYQSYNFLRHQAINDDFILEYLKIFDKEHINVILKYQKNNISEEIQNKLNIYSKLL